MTTTDISIGGLPSWQVFLQLGLLVILCAGIIYFVGHRLTKRLRRLGPAFAGRSLKLSLLVGISLVGTLPALVMAVALAERSANQRHDAMLKRMAITARVSASEVDHVLDKHKSGIVSAAKSMSVNDIKDSSSLNNWLTLYHGIYDNFLTMLATDGSGNIRAATSLLDGQPAPIADLTDQNVSDRSYFREPMMNGQIFVSEVFQGRGLGNDAIVAVSAPFRDRVGDIAGVVEGSLDLRAFRAVEAHMPMPEHSVMVILDQRHRVIYASRAAGLETLRSMVRSPMVQGALRAGDDASFDYAEDGEQLGGRWPTSNGWHVYLSAPLASMQKQMVGDYRVAALLVLLAILLALALTTAIVRRVSMVIGGLTRSLESFTLEGDGANFTIPDGTPAEFRPVFRHMRHRSRHLRKTHERLRSSIETGQQLSRELTAAITRTDVEVEERTQELQEANTRLEDLSRKDTLTGITNRRGFEAFASRMRRMCMRDGLPMTQVMVDIDYFKKYNDALGHQQGDVCLRQVAAALAQCACRPLDIVARWGGEEFVALLAATPPATGVVVAERMRRAIRDLAIPHPDSDFGVVTISVGVAGDTPKSKGDPRDLLLVADGALYAAKTAGRDRVFGDDGSGPREYDPAIDGTNVAPVLVLQQPGAK